MSSLVFPSAILAAKLVSREPFTGVLVDEAASGKEARSSWQSTTRYRYRLAFDIVRTATRFDLQRLQGFFQRVEMRFGLFQVSFAAIPLLPITRCEHARRHRLVGVHLRERGAVLRHCTPRRVKDTVLPFNRLVMRHSVVWSCPFVLHGLYNEDAGRK
jgi:hypothetical protein